MPDLVLRGLPRSLQHDGWWLAAASDGEAPAPTGHPTRNEPTKTHRSQAAWGLLLVLVILADWLFWGYAAGLSLPIFAGSCLSVILTLAPHRFAPRALALLVGAFLMSALPVIETVQALSLLFLIGGSLGIATLILLGGHTPLARLPALTARLVRHLPGSAVTEVADIAASPATLPRWQGLARDWAVPLSVGFVFIMLLVSANPVAERWSIEGGDWLAETLLGSLRPLFWALIALPLWPLLTADRLRTRLERPAAPRTRPTPALSSEVRAFFNPASVLRSLILFNLIFAAQTGLDLRYLWSGTALPDGMTYAEYAHRGAYPLVATALLAGAFALACRPFATTNRSLRALLMLWIAQNVLLVISSLYRLDLYVDSYGLTYLRAYAAVWMGLVAAGLVSVVWQIAGTRSNGWLIAVNTGLTLATLYACAFVNFAHLIATHNLAQSEDEVDYHYVCDLGPDAAAALRIAEPPDWPHYCAGHTIAEGPVIAGWRDWGFRSWRIRRYLAERKETGLRPDAGENPRH
ncbi:MAG: DUF4173 domain-containing protein [Albidovulum sp.]|uniref:DUF4153 domain-containing protein n=1 Tax=Albidovulum sp. TaxID=1872424 RepID=UPI003CAC71A3